jgi:tetratricopeptide (TPR) repeat protein
MNKFFKHIFSLLTSPTNSPRLVRRGVRSEVILALILHFSLLTLHSSLLAQTPKIDSLKKALSSLPKPSNQLSDSTYINTIQQLAFEYIYINPDTAIILAQKGLQLSEKIQWKKGKAICLNALGWSNHVKGNYSQALEYYNTGLKLAEEFSDKSLQAKILGNIGNVYAEQSDYPKALAYYFKALKMKEELGDKREIAITLGNIGVVYKNQSDYPKALEYYFKALKLNEELGDKRNIAINLGNIGLVYKNQSDYPKALEYYFKALKIDEELSNKKGIAIHLGNIGLVYKNQSDYPKALEYYFKALKIDEELGNKNGIARHLSNIGNVYNNLSDYPKALEYYFKALKIDEELGNKIGMAIRLGNIGGVYHEQSDYPKALAYYFKALKMTEELGDKSSMAYNLGNIGIVYADQSDYPKALAYFLKALRITEELGDKRNTAFWLGNIGNLYRKTGKFKESEKYLKQALALSNSLGTLDVTRDNEYDLSQLYDTLGQYKLALIHYKKYIAARDTIYNDEKRKQINYLANKYEWEKKEAVMKEQQKKERALFLANQRRNKIILYSVLSGLALVLVFSFFIYRSLRITKKQKHIIEAQKQLVEEKNKEITDSIRYAKRIQNAILPPDKVVKQYLKESFILYMPKDIVAGDFYWLENKNNTVLFAAADCTGHGVPGAMVSVICNNGLNRSVREHGFTEPGKILDKTREIVVAEFEKSEEDVKDGMDISLCALNGNHLQWAGANNPLWIIRNGELIEYAPNKQPIGKVDNPAPFTTHHIELQQGDRLYIFSDGYADQFGG